MNTLLHVNVNEHTEKKNNLTYLSWAWAWAEALKADPAARYEVRMFGGADQKSPVCWIGDTGMVCVEVVIGGLARECWLPIMDNRNKAIKQPDAFAVNTAIQRCMTKALSLHGLGLYIYAGEDLPEEDKRQAVEAANHKQARGAELEELALFLVDCNEQGNDIQAIEVWYADETWANDAAEKQEEQTYVWGLLKANSKLRSAIKANHPDRLAAAAAKAAAEAEAALKAA